MLYCWAGGGTGELDLEEQKEREDVQSAHLLSWQQSDQSNLQKKQYDWLYGSKWLKFTMIEQKHVSKNSWKLTS